MILGSVLAFVGAMLGHLVVFTLGLEIAFWVHAKRWPKNAVSTKKKNGCVANGFHAMFNYVCEVFFGVAVAFGL